MALLGRTERRQSKGLNHRLRISRFRFGFPYFSSSRRLLLILIILAFLALLPPFFFHFRLRRIHQNHKPERWLHEIRSALALDHAKCYVLSVAGVMPKTGLVMLATLRGASSKKRNYFIWTMLPFYMVSSLWAERHTSVSGLNSEMQLKRCGWLHDPPLVCAHGGDSTNAFPNTIAAYQYAIHSKVDCIEIDVSRSSDGILLALHDSILYFSAHRSIMIQVIDSVKSDKGVMDLQRISGNITSKVGHLSMKEIGELDLSHQRQSGSQKISTIEDSLKLISGSVRVVILDVKIGPPSYEKGLAQDILLAVRKMQCENCVIWTKSDSLAREIIKLSSDVTVGYIVMIDPYTGSRTRLLRMKGAGVVGVYHPLIDANLMRIMHRRNKKVYAWTVDDADSMARMLHEHVDAVVTSNPSMLQRVMQNLRTECFEEGYSLARS